VLALFTLVNDDWSPFLYDLKVDYMNLFFSKYDFI